MARKPAPPTGKTLEDRAIDAALSRAADVPWHEVRLADIAEGAGVSLAELRGLFDGKQAILAAFSARIDRQVLDGLDADLADEPARDRLFDLVMARLDALGPHREAVRSIVCAFEARPAELLAWNAVAVRSMAWMLEAAGIDASGRMGAVRAQGLAMAYGRTLKVWLKDEDPGMARTMVELDRRLRDGEAWLGRIAGLCSFADAVSRGARRGRRRDDEAHRAGASPG